MYGDDVDGRAGHDRRLATLPVLAVAFLAVACSGNGPEVTVPPLLDEIETLRLEARIPGLAVALIRDSEVIALTGLGVVDVENGLPVDADTPFNIASVTKTISGTVAMSLRDEGLLDLDAAMSSFDEFDELCGDAKEAGGLFFDDWACDDPQLTIRHVLSMTANGTPGSRFFYNPVSFSWASRPMKQVTGKPFSTLVQERVFERAGMRRSARTNRDLPLRPDLAAALATPHHLNSQGIMERSPPPPPQGDGAAGGVTSTARDLTAFDAALDRGQLIADASRTEMWTAQGPSIPYGIGWYVTEFRGETVVWHTGLWEGAYSALYIKVPAKRATLILLANSDGLWWGMGLDEATLERSPFALAFLETVMAR